MLDILKTIIKYIPAYLNEFLALIKAPKTFIANRNRDNLNDNFINALVFLGITICLVWLLQAPLLQKDEFLPKFVSALIRLLVTVVLFSAVLRLSWRIVGGKAPLKSFMITYAYFSGIIMFLIVIFTLVGNGVIKAFSPDLYKLLLAKDMEAIANANPLSDIWYIVGICVMIAGFVVSTVWGLVGWGAYRQLNDLTKGLSITAMFLVGVLSIPVQAMLYFLGIVTS